MTSDSRLQDRVAIVAGGGSRGSHAIGTGAAAAIVFARHGARVLVADRDLDAAIRTVDVITAKGGHARAIAADLTDDRECSRIVRAVMDDWGRIDILDNNLGITRGSTVVDSSEDDWERVIAVNIGSVVKLSRAVIPVMAQQRRGAIINISSVSAIRPRGHTPYSTTKGAVLSLTRAMAVDHAEQGIRVNCIIPGPLFTPMVADMGMTTEQRDRRRRSTALGIEGTGWDVAYAALFLASDESRYITGTSLLVDGGASARSPQS